MRPAPALLIAGMALALLPGCVTRKLFLKTEPAGAQVWLDGRLKGTTPYEEDLPAYGIRKLELRLPGHAREVHELDVSMPWYQYWPLDMVSEFLVPWTIEDERRFEFSLTRVDPEADDWDAARAAVERLRAFKQATAPPPGDAPTDGD